ncbi:DUF2243 domain-containing protein [Siminovitchia sediminis]|uniref:DUF2243 domain-containing protein n=1 Tax=Siminovitchia sediminis TaxID=1274353 RepID=A0ABW4KF11_9BACI
MEKGHSSVSDHTYVKRNLLSGFLFGVGLAAFLDEVLFHQLLQWHHFYDQSTTQMGIISDGLFHAFSWFATVGGLFMFADLRRRKKAWIQKWWGGVLLGTGLFQLYDGLIQHKVLRIHQIRYVENLFIYDLIWNVIAIFLLITGMMVIRSDGGSRRKKKP